MIDALSSVFYDTLNREGKEVKRFSTNETFRAFFRRNNDNTSEKSTLILYYPVTAPVKAGSLVTYKGVSFLAINQETVENEVYLKSGLLQTNGTVTTNNQTVVGLPFYGDTNINNAMAQQDSHFSVIDGNISILTEDCPQSRKLAINDTLNEWGRSWRISNIFFINGICHIALEVVENIKPVEVTYSVAISGLDTLNVAPGDTAQITATAMRNDDVEADAAITFESSDDSVATINQDGVITFLRDGEVRFKATWAEHDVFDETDVVTVASVPVSESLSIFVTPLEETSWDWPEELTYYGVRGGMRDDGIPVGFRVENLTVDSNYDALVKKIVITDNGNHTITLEVTSEKLRNKSFDLVAYIPDTDVEYRQTIKVVSFF